METVLGFFQKFSDLDGCDYRAALVQLVQLPGLALWRLLETQVFFQEG